jgi:hypothetical protein
MSGQNVFIRMILFRPGSLPLESEIFSLPGNPGEIVLPQAVGMARNLQK